MAEIPEPETPNDPTDEFFAIIRAELSPTTTEQIPQQRSLRLGITAAKELLLDYMPYPVQGRIWEKRLTKRFTAWHQAAHLPSNEDAHVFTNQIYGTLPNSYTETVSLFAGEILKQFRCGLLVTEEGIAGSEHFSATLFVCPEYGDKYWTAMDMCPSDVTVGNTERILREHNQREVTLEEVQYLAELLEAENH